MADERGQEAVCLYGGVHSLELAGDAPLSQVHTHCYTQVGHQGNPLKQTDAVGGAAGAGASARGAGEENVDLGQLLVPG